MEDQLRSVISELRTCKQAFYVLVSIQLLMAAIAAAAISTYFAVSGRIEKKLEVTPSEVFGKVEILENKVEILIENQNELIKGHKE